GGRPLVFVRGSDGEIRALYNTCSHRGAIVCRRDEGNAKTFQCFYHAWTFDNCGTLVGIPDPDGYDTPGFDRAQLGLKPVPRHESHRDFHFVCFDPEAPPLNDYLAGAREILDVVADQSLEGRMRVVSGTQRYSIRANWKLLAENSYDGYHAIPLHRTYLAYLQGSGALVTGGVAVAGGSRALGNGHAVIEYQAPWGRPVARFAPTFGEDAKREIEAIRADLFARHGEERGKRIADWNRNLGIFPNLVVNDIMAVTIRTFFPIRAGVMEVTAWELAPAEESGERLERRLHNFLEFLGPGGFATPDDVEALDSCQIGFAADGVEWSDVSRGMGREPRTDDELQMRTFWRAWRARMTDTPMPDWSDRPGKGTPR
ncbi:MAG: p-cumate 2,3-dioxygenase subunit alpha, partial [Candidatus Binatota bacterium]|nr:p-cumate 2,3-dioxygenase subunit alpha [Candidatus Binatota bacterium]